MRKFLCLALAVLMLISCLVACGETAETDDGEQGTTAATGAATEGATVDAAEEALKDLTDVDWGGEEFGVMYVNDIAGYTEEIEAEKEAGNQTSSAVINDAVYERNSLLEERCHLTLARVPTSNASIRSAVQNEVTTTTGDFYLVTTTTSGTASMATSGFLYNFLDMDNIDYEQDWWDPGTLNFAMDGKVFFMNGAHNIVDDDVTFVMMFNKELQEDKKIESPYATVKNKEWTLDYFNSIIQGASEDDGDSVWDEKDTYGFTAPSSIGNTFFYGAGLQYVKNDQDMDVPELVLKANDLEKVTQVLSKALNICHGGHASYLAPQSFEGNSKDMFVQGRAIFYVEAASYLRALNQTMEKDYGVVPIPKYDKAQENYLTWTHNIGSTLSMPTSVAKKAEQLEGVLETYVILSYQLVKPAYYDTMLTIRNVRDPQSSEMLDLIFQNRTYDMAMYFDTLGMANLFADCVAKNSDAFSSAFAGPSKRFDRSITIILKELQDN